MVSLTHALLASICLLQLVRRLLRQALVALRGNNFRKHANELFAAALEETVLSSGDAAPLGLLMHFTEVYLEEVAKVGVALGF